MNRCACLGCNDCVPAANGSGCVVHTSTGLMCSRCAPSLVQSTGRAIGTVLLIALVLGIAAIGIAMRVAFIRWAVGL